MNFLMKFSEFFNFQILEQLKFFTVLKFFNIWNN